MIANFTSSNNSEALARYLMGYGKGEKSDKQATVLNSAGVRTDTLAHLIADFELGRKLHPELEKSVLHISLSFNPSDAARMTDQKMRQVADDYMEKMDLKGTQYLVVRHRDRPHEHLHIMANRVSNDGHTVQDGNNFFASKKALEIVFAKHELTPAKGNRPHLQHPERLRGKDLGKHEMRQVLRPALGAETQRPALLATLEAQGLKHQLFFDKDGNAIGISFKKGDFACKGSALGPEFSLAAIDRQLAANQQKALEAVEQRADSTPPVGPVFTAVVADKTQLPAALPTLESARGEAVIMAGSSSQFPTELTEAGRSEVPVLVKEPVVTGTVIGVSVPSAPEAEVVTVEQREQVSETRPIPEAAVEATIGAKAETLTLVPTKQLLPSEGPISSDQVLIGGEKTATVPATGEPVPTPAEVPTYSIPTVAEATLLSMPVTTTLADAQQEEQEPGSGSVSTASKRVDADEPTISILTDVSPAEAAGHPATNSSYLSAMEEALASWEAQQQADAEEEQAAQAYHTWLELGAQVRQQVTVATHEALTTGVAFATLLGRQGLDLLPATHDEPLRVQHRASGEIFPPEEVPLPTLLLTPVSQATAYYGLVQMGDTAERPAMERLAQVRQALLEAGLTLGPVEPARAGQPAQLAYAFSPQQADLTLVMAKLDGVQAAPKTWVLEAPHELQLPSGKGRGHAVPHDQWPDREGQFNQAQLEIDNADQRAASRADRLRHDLKAQDVLFGPVQTDAQGSLSFEMRYHTHAPNIEAISLTLLRAKDAVGINVRESKQQERARYSGLAAVTAREESKGYGRG